ncbi:MAG TPA: DUF1360 domain-containing protein [Candidatus Paceibacterota bacterium]
MTENQKEQNLWNIFFMLVYMVFLVCGLFIIVRVNGHLPRSIATVDLILIVLATFRLVRLFVYDKIMRWMRHMFADIHHGPRKTINDLLGCPWCLGLWMGTTVVFFYFLAPAVTWFFILILAISGVATSLQLLANLVGWNAEKVKRSVESMK